MGRKAATGISRMRCSFATPTSSRRSRACEGKLGGKEVDFVATRDGRALYARATDGMSVSETAKREIAPLKSIRDNHEKIVVVRRGSCGTDIDGIRIVSARDFFL